ncbi:SDR family NAD(P)-dependent oxidoreductase [Actinomadura sp. WAC 06369]|uniref:SDR family NAD(P)-dependent oxidoreductase n=1 Tax=Actinomadura sp. WAC 06369 TaxID=2203193 RepID=UPI001315A0B5|nr:SDR family oxidoreductase [Actinomadura sp. WAC 06369]
MGEFRRDRGGHVIPVAEPEIFPVHRGKRFIVTGGTGGVGAATAELLLREGASVVIADLSAAASAALAERLGGPGRGAHGVGLDLRDPASVAAAAERSFDLLGGVDGLANAAGVVEIAPALRHARPLWEAQFGVNVFGPFELSRLVAERMIEQGGGGGIVNVASEAGKNGHPDMVAYNASKAAVINWTRVAAAEWAPYAINVNCVCPGGVATPMLRQVADAHAAAGSGDADAVFAYMANEQLGRHIAPVEVAWAVSFLLGDRVQGIRGQSINVDGGVSPY